jgi:hypothetical protein
MDKPTLLINAGLQLLPARYNTTAAKAMLIAIGLQESRFTHRVQVKGPAKGYWQFEKNGGVLGVMEYHSTQSLIEGVCLKLNYPMDTEILYRALQHNDLLAVCFARLLLYPYPGALPERGNAMDGWHQYIQTWRPGKPHRETWDDFYEQAWDMVS